MKTISATEANRNFAKILDEARHGETYVVTSHGAPIAGIVPLSSLPVDDEAERRRKAFSDLMDRLDTQPAQNLGPWTRDELYEDD